MPLQERPYLTSIAPEIREIILDHVFNRDAILFEKHRQQLEVRNWSMAVLRTCRQLHIEGKAALRRVFQRTTIQYHNFPFHSAPYDKLDDGDIVHYRFVLRNGPLFESMEILRIPFTYPDLSHFPSLKHLTIGCFKHRLWSVHVPKTIFPLFHDVTVEGILKAWDAVCQRMRSDNRRFPFANFILDLVDGKEDDGRSFMIFVRLIVEAQTSGVSDVITLEAEADMKIPDRPDRCRAEEGCGKNVLDER